MTKRLFLSTYGCQMNVHDSERMLGLMQADGYEPAESAASADVVVINTCAVREKPERKLLAELGNLKKLKKANPNLIIAVSGCMAPRDGELIRTKAPHVDLLLGPRSIGKLPDLVRKVELQRLPIDAVDLMDDPTPITPVRRSSTISAWVDVMFGCSFACTFCAVPSARGAEVSRPPTHILAEIDELAQLGYKEVTLLGQTVNAYGRDLHYRLPWALFKEDRYPHLSNSQEDRSPNLSVTSPINRETTGGTRTGTETRPPDSRERTDFAWLLRQIDSRAKDLRVRFTSPHPQLFNDRLITAIAELPSVCEHVHLPLQSADDAVLRNMKRAYNYSQFTAIVDKLRQAVPGIAITTDIIVGFPGETDAQFRATLNSLEECPFDQAYMFIYSPRRQTEAFDFQDLIPKEIATARMQELVETANNLFRKKNEAQVGQEFEVLVEGVSEKNQRKLTGRTRQNKTMVFEGSRDLIGKLVNVEAEKGFMWGFEGKADGQQIERIKQI